MRIGYLVNPFAGLGGSAGLKGSDGAEVQALALARGAVAAAGARARKALEILAQIHPGTTLVTVPGALGADWAQGLALDVQIAAMPPLTHSGQDTIAAARVLAQRVDILVFAGGDGTARDVVTALSALALCDTAALDPVVSDSLLAAPASSDPVACDVIPAAPASCDPVATEPILAHPIASDPNTSAVLPSNPAASELDPFQSGGAENIAVQSLALDKDRLEGGLIPCVLGIPCGVKMHSGVFARSPAAAGRLLADLAPLSCRPAVKPVEIVDIDEGDLRAGKLSPRIFGHLNAPDLPGYLQAPKMRSPANGAAVLARTAAAIVAEMQPNRLYLIGPGTSAGAVAAALGICQPLLGVSAVLDGQCLAGDADARQLEALAEGRALSIILGITGRQGFLLGRGNQQITPALIRRAGREGLIVLASEDKLSTLESRSLWVDTGDRALDQELSGYLRIRTHPARFSMFRIGGS